jgi:hypothetical protein
VRGLCLALPESTEKLAWGEPTFRVRDKLFAMYADSSNHHGAGRDCLWLKAPEGVQPALVEAAPDRFFVPPYVGKDGWIGVYLDSVDDFELEVHVRQAFLCAAPARLRREGSDSEH